LNAARLPANEMDNKIRLGARSARSCTRTPRSRPASLTAALALAVEVEALAEQYWRALQIGPPNLLSDAEMETVLEKFRTYGQPDAKR